MVEGCYTIVLIKFMNMNLLIKMLKGILHIHSYFKVCARAAQHDCCFASMWFQVVVIAVLGLKLAKIWPYFFPQIFFLWLLEYRLFIASDLVSSQRTIFIISVLQLLLSLY